jgi:inosine/xanthosine triphosphatase
MGRKTECSSHIYPGLGINYSFLVNFHREQKKYLHCKNSVNKTPYFYNRFMLIAAMLIAIGTTNTAKVQALEEVLKGYSIFENTVQIIPFSVPSGVSDQPLSLQETIEGAKNRAKNSFIGCDSCSYGFGIESGLLEAPGTRTGFLHVSVCSIYNGKDHYVGLSTGFEVPPAILSLVTDKKMDLSQACLETGISTNTSIGSQEGLVGILTNGRVDRKEYSKQAIRSALVQLEYAEWYTQK